MCGARVFSAKWCRNWCLLPHLIGLQMAIDACRQNIFGVKIELAALYMKQTTTAAAEIAHRRKCTYESKGATICWLYVCALQRTILNIRMSMCKPPFADNLLKMLAPTRIKENRKLCTARISSPLLSFLCCTIFMHNQFSSIRYTFAFSFNV